MIAPHRLRNLKDARVLVLAAQFPALNQPWMDTYLQQLDAEGLPFAVLSKQVARWQYNAKVDQLGFMAVRVLIDDRVSAHLRALVACFRTRPVMALASTIEAWQVGHREPGPRARISTLLRAASVTKVVIACPSARVIHAHSLEMGYEAIAASRTWSLPIILTFHGLEPSGVRQVPVSRRLALFAYATRVLVNTAFARDHAVELGCPAHKLVIIPQGLPVEDFRFHPRAAPQRGEQLRLLSVGRFHRDKGQQYAIIALARLRKGGVNAFWHFAGVGPDRGRLEALATRLGVRSYVEFHEAVPAEELRGLYHHCHLFVLASIGSKEGAEHMETQGVVLQEAQASGCIPIATRTGGIPECIADGHDGMLVEERSHRAIANAIERLLAQPEVWHTLQQNGRRTVEDRFSAEVIGRRMAAILEEVAGPLAQDRDGIREAIRSNS